jgi:hypothetical protein
MGKLSEVARNKKNSKTHNSFPPTVLFSPYFVRENEDLCLRKLAFFFPRVTFIQYNLILKKTYQ